jgi:hypothetical protein
MGAVASEGRAHFDKLLSFLNAVSSPLRKDLMKRAGRDASEQAKSPKQARASRHRAQDAEPPAADLIPAEPSAREIAAAKAARERLYGAQGQVRQPVATTSVRELALRDVLPGSKIPPFLGSTSWNRTRCLASVLPAAR